MSERVRAPRPLPDRRMPLAGMKKASGDWLANPQPNKRHTNFRFHFTDPDGKVQQHEQTVDDLT